MQHSSDYVNKQHERPQGKGQTRNSGARWTRDLPGHYWAYRTDASTWFCMRCGWVSEASDPPKRPCVGPGEAVDEGPGSQR